MTDTAGIVKKANEIVQICGTRDPHRIAQTLGIPVMPSPFEKQKGAYKVIINISSMERIVISKSTCT